MKTLDELLEREDPAWPMIQGWMKGAVEALPPSKARSDELVKLQVSTRSGLGAVVYETGGLRVDRGWVRVLGSGHPALGRSLISWNRPRTWPDPGVRPSHLLVADDVVGGSFAIDWGGLGFEFNTMAYFAPDTLRWESLKMGHTDWIQWLLSADLGKFYADYRWPGWEVDVQNLPGDRGYMIAPPAFLKDRRNYHERSRGEVPMSELYGIHLDFAEQLKDVKDGEEVVLRIRKAKPS